MNYENTLNERSQIRKATYYMIPFISNARAGKSMEAESRFMVAREMGNDFLIGPGFLSG